MGKSFGPGKPQPLEPRAGWRGISLIGRIAVRLTMRRPERSGARRLISHDIRRGGRGLISRRFPQMFQREFQRRDLAHSGQKKPRLREWNPRRKSPKKPRIRIRVAPQAIAALFVPPLLTFTGEARHAAPIFVLGVGLPVLAVLSFGFLAISLPALLRSSRSINDTATAIPERGRIGEILKTRTSPRVPHFLPGVRLQVVWSLRFGPFLRTILAPLAGSGKDGRELNGGVINGSRGEQRGVFRERGIRWIGVRARGSRGGVREGAAAFRIGRRGLWEGKVHLRAVDPFGFFRADFPLTGSPRIVVPPFLEKPPNPLPTGRLSADEKSAPRIREDSDERLERRGYIPGDDPRRIDWKQYARTGDLLVRVGEEAVPVRGRVWISVAASSDIYFRRSGYNRLDRCLEAASALVRGSLENDRDVRLHLPGGSWLDASGRDWEAAMAAAEPSRSAPVLRRGRALFARRRVSTTVSAPTAWNTDESSPSSGRSALSAGFEELGELEGRSQIAAGEFPPQGETLLLVIHPSDSAGLDYAEAARSAGCRVSLFFPDSSFAETPGRRMSAIRATQGKKEFREGFFRRREGRPNDHLEFRRKARGEGRQSGRREAQGEVPAGGYPQDRRGARRDIRREPRLTPRASLSGRLQNALYRRRIETGVNAARGKGFNVHVL